MASTQCEFDCLIFGGGLAGSVLAWTLIENGKRPLVVDDPAKSRCSRVAAGLVNPIGGKRLNLVWEAETQIPFAIEFYRQLGGRFDRQFWTPRKLARLLSTRNEEVFWEQKNRENGYAAWWSPLSNYELESLGVFVPTYGFSINGGGLVNVPSVVSCIRESLSERGLLKESEFQYEDVEATSQAVRWKQFTAPVAVFAEGHRATGNPWFSFIPYKPAKGVIGSVSTENPIGDTVIIAEKFLIPKSTHSAIVGATYRWDDQTEEPDSEGIAELEEFLRRHLGKRWEWREIQAGVRPSVPGAKPVVGPHPERANLFSFNGFGSKGATQTPYLAKMLHDFVWSGGPLVNEVRPARFYKKTARFPKRWIAVEIARDRVLEHVGAGDSVVDATAGNGHDTLWLAKRVGRGGKVYAFDIQKSALSVTRKRLESEGELDQTVFVNACHSTLCNQLPPDVYIAASVFNLGYLPEGDKSIVTKAESTISALQQSLSILRPNGILSLVVYPAHEGGNAESEEILRWSKNIDPEHYQIEIVSNPSGNPASPYLLFVVRKNSPNAPTSQTAPSAQDC